jgi:hypothetical protein
MGQRYDIRIRIKRFLSKVGATRKLFEINLIELFENLVSSHSLSVNSQRAQRDNVNL